MPFRRSAAPDTRQIRQVDESDGHRPPMPDTMAIRRRLERQSVYLRPPTEIDLATVDELRSRLDQIGPDEDVVVDLREVEFCGVVGLDALIDAHLRAAALGSSLTLTNPPAQFERLLDAAGVDGVLDVRRPPKTRRRRTSGTDGNRR